VQTPEAQSIGELHSFPSGQVGAQAGPESCVTSATTSAVSSDGTSPGASLEASLCASEEPSRASSGASMCGEPSPPSGGRMPSPGPSAPLSPPLVEKAP
jgi:hypothetical protein